MRTGYAVRKVAGGKMVRVDAVFGLNLEDLTITGDFFLHPEETLRALEHHLIGTPLDGLKNRDRIIARELDGILRKNNALLIGIAPQDILDALLEATR
ncbi:MAG: hypothetical protein GXP63_01035 [DPANN group archaeon]|nr:hypothetical protein [DPANN group archaeon]